MCFYKITKNVKGSFFKIPELPTIYALTHTLDPSKSHSCLSDSALFGLSRKIAAAVRLALLKGSEAQPPCPRPPVLSDNESRGDRAGGLSLSLFTNTYCPIDLFLHIHSPDDKSRVVGVVDSVVRHSSVQHG